VAGFQNFEGTHCLLKLEVAKSSKPMISYHMATQCHNLEDCNLNFQDMLGKHTTIQPVHATEGKRKQPVRKYRMDKHYIPGKLIFFIYVSICP
jgi:hypothetical protein